MGTGFFGQSPCDGGGIHDGWMGWLVVVVEVEEEEEEDGEEEEEVVVW